ncbi:ABC transporter substrate-binding protein [Agromyces humatus]|uniref:ABC transporter substrate-binding protein n=1 Tax=Agromyces humatus TaxID=279573 RepID=A0ABN2KRB1_9MICO|nr:ABC transporter substrate-binding protein [Agromyces humatus]
MKLAPLARVAAVTAATALIFTGCAAGSPSGSEGASSGGGTLNIGAVLDIASWDPSQAHVGHALQPYQAPYDTLILREPDGTLSPMLATEWAYDEDQTALTVDLRDDVTFSDGEVFDAEAVKTNLDTFKAANGRQAAQLTAVDSVDVVDEDTVQINLSAPDPSFTYYLSQAAGLMGSPASLGTDEIAAEPVGTGPYVMDPAGSVVGSQYTFTPREDYWNHDLQKFDKIVFKVLTDPTARLNAIVSKQVDVTLLEARQTEQADAAGLELLESQVDWTGLLLFDRDGELNPALADVTVRQAINHALDRETMLEQIQLGYGTVTNQVFGPESGAYVDELDETYPYDPEKAKDLLAEAGYADGFDLVIPSFVGLESISAAITQQLGDVGIRVQTETVPVANIVSDFAAGKYPVGYFFLFQGEPWVAINQLISTEALYNPFDSTSPELQELIDAVHFGGDEAGELAKDVNRYVTENAWFAPLYRLDQIVYVNPATITAEPQIQQAVPSIYNFAPAE